MSEQVLWIIFGVLVLGIFVGGNLGILMMCLLQVSKRADMLSEELLAVAVSSEDQMPKRAL